MMLLSLLKLLYRNIELFLVTMVLRADLIKMGKETTCNQVIYYMFNF